MSKQIESQSVTKAENPKTTGILQRVRSGEQGEDLQEAESPFYESRFQANLAMIPVREVPNKTGLPDGLKAGVEALSGFSMDEVRVHYNSSKPAQLQALAYTQGREIHVGPGQERHLPHEAWHVVQQMQGRVEPTRQMKGVQINDDQGLEREADVMGNGVSYGEGLIAEKLTNSTRQSANNNDGKKPILQARFNPATINDKAHLRADGHWNTLIGNTINQGASILVDDESAQEKQSSVIRSRWKPAINVDPNAIGMEVIGNGQKGYIRSNKVQFNQGETFERILFQRIKWILQSMEERHDCLQGHLAKDNHVQHLMNNALFFNTWGNGNLDNFAAGFNSIQDRLERIQEGADHVRGSLIHWRSFLFPEHPDLVRIKKVNFLGSDLHEKGLGVLDVEFIKPLGGAAQWSSNAFVKVIIKPEDKTLEQNLLGDQVGSAANEINRIVGLNGQNALATIKMATDAHYGAMVQKVRGTRAKDIAPNDNARAFDHGFHEALVFAFLAGIDDLHGENVYWVDGKPYLIDADNVLIHHQMVKERAGARPQQGFTRWNQAQATQHIQDVTNMTNVSGSHIMQTMLNNPVKRGQIINILKRSIQGKKGRVVPIYSQQWGQLLMGYSGANGEMKQTVVESCARPTWMVLENEGQREQGPGLFGCTYKNEDDPFYSEEAEREQIRYDLDKGVIPFYMYNYSTGVVTHNGVQIYYGQTLKQAMTRLYDRFMGI